MIPIYNCEPCDEITSGTQGLALWPKLVGPASESRVVLENDAYVALVTVGPIVRGHCLLVPRLHRLSMTRDNYQDRLLLTDILHRLVAKIEQTYRKSVLLFEHGAAEGSDVRPCTVSHAHWHLVPSSVKAEELLQAEYTWRECTTPWVNADCEYLLVGDARTRFWVTYPETKIPSQSLRKMLAERIGSLRSWDWRNEPAIELVLQTLADFRAPVS